MQHIMLVRIRQTVCLCCVVVALGSKSRCFNLFSFCADTGVYTLKQLCCRCLSPPLWWPTLQAARNYELKSPIWFPLQLFSSKV
jgi:hypothetical protein